MSTMLSEKYYEACDLSLCSMEGIDGESPISDAFKTFSLFGSNSSSTSDETSSTGSFEILECPSPEENAPSEEIVSFSTFVKKLDDIYSRYQSWEVRKKKITCLLTHSLFDAAEVDKYAHWDSEKLYTRNLVATDHKNYTLLILCWNPGKESKIHNHPCDGCFVKGIRGYVKETRYQSVSCSGGASESASEELVRTSTGFLGENQVTFMDDTIGLHKIGNPSKENGAISLHLYTPPFSSCKVWTNTSADGYLVAESAAMGYFSVFGYRTPHLEGRPGSHAMMLADIKARRRDED